MTNFERYKSEVLKLLNDFSVNKTTRHAGRCCTTVGCNDCLFANKDNDCNSIRIRWLYEEYEEPSVDWSKVPIDTKVLTSDDGQLWYEYHFAGVHHESKTTPLVWLDGKTSWSTRFPEQKEMFNYVKLAEVD